jgi:hypothetical protein
MTSRNCPSDDLLRLLWLTLDGVLAPHDHYRLAEILHGDAGARRLFVELLRVHALLQDQAVVLCLSSEPDVDTSQKAGEPTSASEPTPRTEISAWMGVTGRLALFVPWTLAATLLLVLFLPKSDQPMLPSAAHRSEPVTRQNVQVATATKQQFSHPPAPVATLASHDNATWKGAQLTIGQPLHEGQAICLEQGAARISVGYGAEIVANGPCLLTFLASDRVRLCDGSIVVDVAEWARGFTVVTDSMDVVDFGTTFSVTAKSGRTAESSVLRAMARALPATTRNSERRSVLLSEGEGLQVDDSGNRTSFKRTLGGKPSDLASQQLLPRRRVKLHNTGFGFAAGNENLHWCVVAGPQNAFRGPDYARVCVPYKRYLDNDPSESQWVSIHGWETAEPNSVYTFQTSFHLEGNDLSTMRLFGRFLADNVYGQRFDQPQFRFVKVTDGLVEGLNIIEIDVFAGTTAHLVTGHPQIEPNHMALRVEWYAFGRHSLVASGKATKSSDELHSMTFAGLFANPDAERIIDRMRYATLFRKGGVSRICFL